MKNKPLFEVNDVDRRFYEKHIAGWLPDKFHDMHTHVFLKKFKPKRKPGAPARTVSWPSMVADENPVEHLIETYQLMFPGKTVTPLMFASLSEGAMLDKANAYIRRVAQTKNFPALIFSDPVWSADDLERRIKEGGFIGIKSYLTRAPAYLPTGEIRIFDFFPHHQLEVMNRHGWIVMLHIPRDGRLRDPVNLAQLLEIEERYPRLQLIVAHVGRAYCPEDVGDSFKVLKRTRRMNFDFSANTNAAVFRQLLETVGSKRVLFGSDLPILRMRTRRICEKGFYINLVPKGLYGNVTVDPHMREVSGAEAEKLTFFMYEELAAFGRAARALKLTASDIKDIFCNNGENIIETARPKPKGPQLEMTWPRSKMQSPPKWSLAKGYLLRTYQSGDDTAYIRLMRRAGFKTWNEKNLQSVLKNALPGGLFFVLERKTSALVATTVALHSTGFRGELGWVACDPAHRGKQLSAVTCAAVTRRFLDAGYTDVYLRTDDFRLAAIKTYLKLGWAPCLETPGMQERWKIVGENLGWKF